MKYAVRWTRRAFDAVAEAWLDNPADRTVITKDVAAADEWLATDPIGQGESREGNRRVVFFARFGSNDSRGCWPACR